MDRACSSGGRVVAVSIRPKVLLLALAVLAKALHQAVMFCRPYVILCSRWWLEQFKAELINDTATGLHANAVREASCLYRPCLVWYCLLACCELAHNTGECGASLFWGLGHICSDELMLMTLSLG